MNNTGSTAQNFLVAAINLYQRTLSPDHGFFKARHPAGYCKFYPSCSEYTKQAVLKRGSFIGMGKGLFRVVRCNPFTKGGIDLP